MSFKRAVVSLGVLVFVAFRCVGDGLFAQMRTEATGSCTSDLYLVASRHAEATHNAEEASVPPGLDDEAKSVLRARILADPQHLDAVLSERGWRSCWERKAEKELMLESLVAAVNETTPHLNFGRPSLAFVSPLRRTLQTAAIFFRDEILAGSLELWALDLIIEKQVGNRPCDLRFPATSTGLAALRAILKEKVVNSRSYVPGITEDDSRAESSHLRWTPEYLKEAHIKVSTTKDDPFTEDAELPAPFSALVDDLQTYRLKESDADVQYRAANALHWFERLAAGWKRIGSASPLLLVSHKAFLREMELAMGVYHNIGTGNAARDWLKRNHLEYGEAETRVYRLPCVENTWQDWRLFRVHLGEDTNTDALTEALLEFVSNESTRKVSVQV